MDVGGYCASGGPYQIRVECPHAIDWLLPVSVIGGIACLFVFLVLALGPVVPALRSGRRASWQPAADELGDLVKRSGQADSFTWDWSLRSSPEQDVDAAAGAAIVAALQRLAELHRSGELTDAEYAAAKQALLEGER